MSAVKRKYGDLSPEPLYSNKLRSKPQQIDPTYGQRSALPGLDVETTMGGDEEDTNLNYDDGMDALAYLRAVRFVLQSPLSPQRNQSKAEEIYFSQENC
jgi:hypothetical protein